MSVTGSLHEKNNSWYAVLALPDDETGIKRPKWIKLGRCSELSKRAATSALERLKSEYSDSVVYSKNILFADWVEEWYKHREISGGLAQTTLEGYRKYIDKHIDPYFRNRKIVLQKIKALDIQRFYDKLLRDGQSPVSVRRYHTVIKQALDYAYKQGILNDNPISRVDVPAAPKTRCGSAYSLEEVQSLLEVSKDERLFPAIHLAVWYGLRREEILGLTWDHIDFDNRTIDICQTVTRVKELAIRPTTKNKRSYRRLTFREETFQMLRQLRTQQRLEQLELGEKYTVNDFVCKMKNGRMMKPDYVSSTFLKILKKNEFRLIRFHDLRHTTATLLLSAGVPLQHVSHYLGHSTIAITMDTYGHLSAETNKYTAEAMEQLLVSSV